MPKIDQLFDKMLETGGSDLHLLEGEIPRMRVHGSLKRIEDQPVLDADTINGYLQELCSRDDWQKFLQSGDLDFACEFGDEARFRANYYFQHLGKAAVFRVIPSKILTLNDLGLPDVLKTFSKQISGLILVTGPTGSGKSTTLAALLNEINETSARYILTIEEPVEFVHPNKKSYFCQREVGKDCSSFQEALQAASRQNCDVILVGEMRDYETISLALSAASMGKLVLGTLHTNSAIKTVDRIIDVFPSDEHWKARNMLADSLYGVCAQILLKTADGKGRVAANEILLTTQGLASTIRDGDTAKIQNIIQSGKSQGMQLMDDAIRKLLDEEVIDAHEAYMKAHEKEKFKLFAENE